MGNLINLGTLRLNNNRLTGTIPLSFGNFTKLTELDLSNNQLTGVIPDIFANLQILYLTLGANQLEGNYLIFIYFTIHLLFFFFFVFLHQYFYYFLMFINFS